MTICSHSHGSERVKHEISRYMSKRHRLAQDNLVPSVSFVVGAEYRAQYGSKNLRLSTFTALLLSL